MRTHNKDKDTQRGQRHKARTKIHSEDKNKQQDKDIQRGLTAKTKTHSKDNDTDDVRTKHTVQRGHGHT